jgi:hypothetical protein
VNKIAKKMFDKCCFFCKESNYALLDVHRIVPGSDGGTYTEFNSLTVCANCHRRIHCGDISIDRKYNSTGVSLWTLHCWIDDEEKWLGC